MTALKNIALLLFGRDIVDCFAIISFTISQYEAFIEETKVSVEGMGKISKYELETQVLLKTQV